MNVRGVLTATRNFLRVRPLYRCADQLFTHFVWTAAIALLFVFLFGGLAFYDTCQDNGQCV